MDDSVDRRKVFMRLTEKEKFDALYGMMTFANGKRAEDELKIEKIAETVEWIERELTGIAHRQTDTKQLSTSEKIDAALSKRSTGWLWYRDKVLPSTLATIQTAILLTLLYLTFGKDLHP